MQTSVRSLPPCFHRTKVGRSQSVAALPGSGKSSALRLIFRFYDPTSGAVFVDGQNIADVTQVSHPIHIAMQLPGCRQLVRRAQIRLSTGSYDRSAYLPLHLRMAIVCYREAPYFQAGTDLPQLVGEFASLQNSHQV